ncbi:MAG TPA: Xaa-Pro aminopeptidase [Bryobacteraceae bacterium]|jgi:Xaa-Pro aminopeptidase|nr:Xaa-Pro aminopeptidase [Bryobacteraceae bacterium]
MNRRTPLVFLLAAGSLLAADAHVWKVAGPPPDSWQSGRVADLASHRTALLDKLGSKALVILYAAEPRNYAGDVDWPYRQENNFFYLTGIAQEGSFLVLLPGEDRIREILFMPPRNPSQETWTGHILSADEGRAISGIREIWDARDFDSFLATLIPPAKAVLPPPPPPSRYGRSGLQPPAPIPVDISQTFAKTIASVAEGSAQLYMLSDDSPEYRREHEFTAKLAAADPGLAIKNPGPMLENLRAVKSTREIALLQHAVDITAEGFQRAYTVAVPGTPEYEIQAQFEFTFLRRNAHWGYPCIVASGVNATTLHYETDKDTMKPGELLLMDDAAEFGGYSADVTRTIPVSGKYSADQAEIYRLVWAGQHAGIEAALPGKTNADITAAASKVIAEGLVKLGLMTDVNSKQQLRIWFNHGISHGIGLNVHDPGRPEFQAGMAITMEPGIYVRPDALDNLPKTAENAKFIAAVKEAFEKYKGIGVRIEDDVLITNGQPQVMSAGIPSKLEEVEAAIAQWRKAVRTTSLP